MSYLAGLGRLDEARLRGERGAVAVTVGLLVTVLVGFAAIAVDLGAAYHQRSQMQNGADAGALAVALDCSTGNCANADATAYSMVDQNTGNNPTGSSLQAPVTPASTSVTVIADSYRQTWFAPILGIKQARIKTKATAIWGPPSQGTLRVPWAISWCDWDYYVNRSNGTANYTSTTMRTIYSGAAANASGGGSAGSSVGHSCVYPYKGVNQTKQGFSWLNVELGSTGNVTSSASCTGTFTRYADPVAAAKMAYYANPPSSTGCTQAFLRNLISRTIFIPVLAQTSTNASDPKWQIVGYAAWKITGYNFPGVDSSYTYASNIDSSKPFLQGYFSKGSTSTGDFNTNPSSAAGSFGATSVELVA